jgi:hypothetical protein
LEGLEDGVDAGAEGGRAQPLHQQPPRLPNRGLRLKKIIFSSLWTLAELSPKILICETPVT